MSGPGDFKPFDSGVTPRYQEPATFMRSRRHPIGPDIDIALAGVPFDLGATYRPGARHGPAVTREASRLIRAVNPATKVAPFRLCNIADVGDAPSHPMKVEESCDMIQGFYEEVHAAGAWPLSVGGDHTVPLPILRAIARDRPLGLFHVDAHADTFDDFMGTKINHATFVRRAVEEGLIDPRRTIQVGLRGTRYGDDDIGYGNEVGITMVPMDEYETMGREAFIKLALEVIGDQPCYLTIDIDGLDPRDCPGTGVPEPGGIAMRDMQVILRSFRGINAVGGDICEVSPPHDPIGITFVNVANLMFEMACLMAENRSKAS
ncbi:MAG: agmatinase [Rhodospirillales bacterium]|nr:agmatinase [Rhodospirillales bacterium]